MDQIVIRHALPADAATVIGLWRATGLTRPWNDPDSDFTKAIAHPLACVLLAEQDGAALGTVMAGYDGHRGWLYYLAVAPDAQRRGLGRELVRAAEAWLAGQGCPKAMLMVRSDNAAVAAFYQALGYDAQDVTTFGRRLD